MMAAYMIPPIFKTTHRPPKLNIQYSIASLNSYYNAIGTMYTKPIPHFFRMGNK